MNSFRRVFLITVDCLRADHVGCISGRNLTPNIDQFARDSVVFKRAFSNGPGTNQSFPAILTSTYFFIHEGLRLNKHCTTLAEVLGNAGFKTVAFHSNPFLSKILGWDKGFHEFYDFMDIIKSPSAFVTRQRQGSLTQALARFAGNVLGAKHNSKVQRFLKKVYFEFSSLEVPYLEGKKLNKNVINWIEKNSKEKFFLWMHYMDPHDPYIPTEEYLIDFSSREEAFNYNLSVDHNNLSKEEVVTLKRLYEGEVRYADICIGEFLYYLEEKRLLDESLIIITGDHGHAFMEHGRFAHAYDILYNEVIHVPLIVFGTDNNQKINSNVQLLDVPPTVLDLLGIKRQSTFIGKSLFDVIENLKLIFSESAEPDLINLKYNVDKKAVSCIKNKFKLILNELKGTKELYDIGKDFQEEKNLFDGEEETGRELVTLIDKHLLSEKAYKMKITLKKEKQLS